MKRRFVFLMIAALVFTGCVKKISKQAVAVVNGKEITMEMVDKKISNLPQYYQTFATQHKKEVLDDMVTEELLYEEAKRINVDRDSDVKELMEEARRKIMISKLIDDQAQKATPVSDDDVKAYYEKNRDQYAVPEMVRASHILVNTEEDAKNVLEQLNKGSDFEELAKKYSKDLTKDRGGDLGYFRKGQMIPEFENECFSMKVGQTSGIVKTRFGYHIIKLTDHKDAAYRSLDEVKDNIRMLIVRDRQKEKFDVLTKKLKDKAKIKIDEKAFPLIKQEEPAAKPADVDVQPQQE